jgi:hypothetical protein
MHAISWEAIAIYELNSTAEKLDQQYAGSGTTLYHRVSQAATQLCDFPELGVILTTTSTALYRRIVVDKKWYLIYINFPVSTDDPDGLISIRHFRSASERDPFGRIRERPYPYRLTVRPLNTSESSTSAPDTWESDKYLAVPTSPARLASLRHSVLSRQLLAEAYR